MDDQAYLNSISSQVRPEKKSAGSFFSSTLGKVVIGSVIAMVVIMIFSSLLGGGGEGKADKGASLKYHIENTLEVISEYQNNVKSSKLRSSSASLTSVLSNSSRDLTNYLVEKLGYKDGAKEYNKLRDEAKLHQDGLTASLFNAKISGTLDRMYAHELAYEIELIMSEEQSFYNTVKDESMRASIESTYKSLANLYPDFDDFSESK